MLRAAAPLLIRRRHMAVYAWGACDDGHLGLSDADLRPDPHTFGRYAPHAQQVRSLSAHPVTRVSLSAAHAAAVTADGYLLVAGLNSWGQLGLPPSSHACVPQFVPVPALPPVLDVACGASHTLVATLDGRVLAAGCNRDGQLGAGAPLGSTPVSDWTEVPGLGTQTSPRITHVVAGDSFSAALDAEGGVYTWGAAGPALGHASESGAQLPALARFVLGGLTGGGATAQPLARRVLGLSRVCALAAGKRHMVAIDRGGRAYAWGDSRHFVLGQEDAEDDRTAVWEPRRAFDGVGGVQKVACGGTHALVLTQGGRVFAVGDGEHGCLGIGDEAGDAQGVRGRVGAPQLRRAAPVDGVGPGVVDVAAGWQCSAAVDRDGAVWTWGGCAGGALGVDGMESDAYAPQRTGLRARRVAMSSSGLSVVALS